ncbi:hypothetical protein KKA95_00690 [Patescibacteria group bacterium]|nr:hypothetical protein [Patescibacteria group bacterium]
MAKSSYAQGYLGEGWDTYIRGELDPIVSSKTGEDLVVDFIRGLIVIARYLMGALALIMGVIYGMALVFARGREESIQNQKRNFVYILIGFIVVIASENIANVFNPERSSAEEIINFQAASDQLRDAVDYVKWLFGSIVVLFMTVSAVRMITAQGEEEVLTKQKNNITWGLIGILVILLASNIVNAIYVINTPDEIVAGSAQTTVTEIASIIQLILVFLGPIAIIFTIYSGFMYLTAMDNEERSQKAKRMIIGGITGI